jgi:tetratricopeptide (TPR) repeat protein
MAETHAAISEELPGDIKINSLGDYINAIEVICDYYHLRKVLFRGLSKDSHKIESSAYRKLKEDKKNTSKDMLKRYHTALLKNAKNINDKSTKKYRNEIELLTHLQHNGAKTIFIDYTYNPLVALWFACSSKKNENGYVAAIKRNFTKLTFIDKNFKKIEKLFDDDNIKIFEPPSINRRIISQQSVLLASPNGFIDTNKHKRIIIPGGKKDKILEQLEIIGINRKTLFPDFNGFTEWFKFDNNDEITDNIDNADICYADEKYDDAMKLYEIALNLTKEKDNESKTYIYNCIGLCYQGKKNYNEARNYYQRAWQINEELSGKEVFKINEEIFDKYHTNLVFTLSNFGTSYNDQENYEKALKYFFKALKIVKDKLGREHYRAMLIYDNIGEIRYKQDENDEALEWYFKAYKISINKSIYEQKMKKVYKKMGKKNFDKWLKNELRKEQQLEDIIDVPSFLKYHMD